MAGYFKYVPAYTEDDGCEMKPRTHRAERLVDSLDGADQAERARAAGRTESAGRADRAEPMDPMGRTDHEDGEGRSDHTVRGRAMDRFTNRTADRITDRIIDPAILSVTPEGEGETLAVVLAMPYSEEEQGHRGKSKRVKLHLLVEQYTDLQARGLVVTPREITRDETALLLEAGELCAAIRRGMGLLQYGDRSARRLASKLTAKGIRREIAVNAVDYLVEKGYIREDDTARLRAAQSLRKGWGPRRIKEDLRAQGFTAEAVEEAMETLTEVDFAENCADVIRKKYGEIPEDRAARQKITASLMRQGYDFDQIRRAMRLVQGYED